LNQHIPCSAIEEKLCITNLYAVLKDMNILMYVRLAQGNFFPSYLDVPWPSKYITWFHLLQDLEILKRQYWSFCAVSSNHQRGTPANNLQLLNFVPKLKEMLVQTMWFAESEMWEGTGEYSSGRQLTKAEAEEHAEKAAKLRWVCQSGRHRQPWHSWLEPASTQDASKVWGSGVSGGDASSLTTVIEQQPRTRAPWTGDIFWGLPN